MGKVALRSGRSLVLLSQTARLDAQLQVGSATETVEVTTNSIVVNTESPVTGTPIDSSTMQALPLAVRAGFEATGLPRASREGERP